MIAYLLKLSVEDNNNRYYKMVQENDHFNIEYGRVGAKPMKAKRPMSLWKETYEKHIADGYIDRTDYLAIQEDGSYKQIEDKDVNEFIGYLLERTRQIIKQNYSVSYSEVSRKMIDDAQNIIYQMADSNDIKEANKLLSDLFVVIPRKMKDVSDWNVTEVEQIPTVVQREQDLLDAMASQVTDDITIDAARKTILEENNLSVSLVTSEKEISKIKKHMGEWQNMYVKAFQIHNKKTDDAFNKYCLDNRISPKDIHFYYHGSKNENYWGIMKDGQKLNPNATICGKMFGHGLYYANKAIKSINYTSVSSFWRSGTEDRGYLAVFKVAYKDALHVSRHESWMPQIRSKRDIQNHDALFAHGGIDLRNDEIIIYDENQVTLRYLIEIRKDLH